MKCVFFFFQKTILIDYYFIYYFFVYHNRIVGFFFSVINITEYNCLFIIVKSTGVMIIVIAYLCTDTFVIPGGTILRYGYG